MIIDYNRYNGGGGSGSGVTPEQVQEQIESALTPYWESGETKDYVDEAVSGISLDGYWTSAQTQSAITIVEDHLYDVEEVTASALTELHEGLVEVSAATSGKADAANVTPNSSSMLFPRWNGEGIITGSVSPTFRPYISINDKTFERLTAGHGNWYSGGFYAPESAGTAGDILVSTGDGAPVWSAMTFPTPDVDKAYVDSAITGVQDQIDVMDEVVATSLVDLNDRIVELSGSSVDLSAYYTSAQTEDAISAATSGKADAANVSANTTAKLFPYWNEQGVITGRNSQAVYDMYININGANKGILRASIGNIGPIYAPTNAGTAGEILVSTGNGAPVWSTDNKVSSTSVSTIWKGTQAEYDAIATKDPATLYIIL